MKIESVDFFYLKLPEVRDIGDGSQDACLVRVRGGGFEGWGECEAAPLPSIAAFFCPMSHSACKPVSASVLGQILDSPGDIRRITRQVRANSFDLLQADHTLSGIDIALWDLLGHKRDAPVWSLLGHARAEPRRPYASVLFGDDPHATLEKGRAAVARGFEAVKFGWGPFGRGSLAADRDHIHAAREGVGRDAILLVDAGTVWGEDVEAAAARLQALEEARVTWLEEPFTTHAIAAYAALAGRTHNVRLAAGEGSHDPAMARNLMDLGGIGFVQIDTGRIGGITSAAEVATRARALGVTYVNHTFTTHLALSASLQPYADGAAGALAEYPVEASVLARELTTEALAPGRDGLLRLPETPGLGLRVNLETVRRHLVEVKIEIGGRVLFETAQP